MPRRLVLFCGMDHSRNKISFRGVNIVDDLLTPLLGNIDRLESILSLNLQDIKAGPFTELRFKGKSQDFIIWLTSASRDTPAFKQTARFKIGYRSTKNEPVAIKMTQIIAALVKKNEGNLKDEVYRSIFLNETSPELELVLFEDMAELRVTLKCNERCPFCNTIVDKHTLPDNVVGTSPEIKGLIMQAARQGARAIVFTGGEPTLLKELPEWIRFTHAQGMDAWIQTNGVIPSSESYWKGFSELPDYVFVSFHTTRPERVKLLTGVGGTFFKKVNTLKLLKNNGVFFGVNFVITRLNMDEIPLIPDFLADLLGVGGYDLTYSFVAPTGRAGRNKDLIPRVQDIQELLATAMDRSQRLGIPVIIPENCGFPRCVMPMYEDFFAASRRSEPIQFLAADRTKFSRCEACKYNSTCIGMWRTYVELYGDAEFQPVKA